MAVPPTYSACSSQLIRWGLPISGFVNEMLLSVCKSTSRAEAAWFVASVQEQAVGDGQLFLVSEVAERRSDTPAVEEFLRPASVVAGRDSQTAAVVRVLSSIKAK